MRGQTISHYRIVSQLGVGGIDIVGPREACEFSQTIDHLSR